jgi:hypothetical protein
MEWKEIYIYIYLWKDRGREESISGGKNLSKCCEIAKYKALVRKSQK